MNLLKKSARYGSSLFLLIVLLPLFGLLLPRKWGGASQPCEQQVCVIRYGYHSNLLIPVQTTVFDWRDHLPLPTDPAPRYLNIGWGAADWYINPPSEFSQQLYGGARALLLPNQALLSVQTYSEFPQSDSIKCAGVSSANYLKLIQHIQNTFQLDVQGDLIKVAERPNEPITFYQARGTYSLLNNSNHWTANGLSAAGLNTPLWPAHAAAIMLHFRESCQRQQHVSYVPPFGFHDVGFHDDFKTVMG
jgi:uncharacterized protein (TIGR02117 family)